MKLNSESPPEPSISTGRSTLQVMCAANLKMFLGYQLEAQCAAVALQSIEYHMSTGPRLAAGSSGWPPCLLVGIISQKRSILGCG